MHTNTLRLSFLNGQGHENSQVNLFCLTLENNSLVETTEVQAKSGFSIVVTIYTILYL